MQKVIVIFKNLCDRNEVTADNIRIEYAGQAIEFRDGKIRVETTEEPARRPNMPPVMHW